jgi:hypothetical protein
LYKTQPSRQKWLIRPIFVDKGAVQTSNGYNGTAHVETGSGCSAKMTQSSFEIGAARLVGKRLEHLWKGYGSHLFLEFGTLTPGAARKDGSPKNPLGEIGATLGARWRICGRQSVLCGSDNDEADWERGFSAIRKQTVMTVSVLGQLPEIQMTFENGASCTSFTAMCGQPDWAVFDRTFDPHVTVHCQQGRIEEE